MTGREITREDFLLMLNGWRTERSLLFCIVDSRLGLFRKLGRLREGESAEGFVLRSDADDRGVEDFVVGFPPDARFMYDEPREAPEVALDSRSILLILDARSDEEKITLFELIEAV